MKSFSYVITDELGIHARPAGLLCKLVKSLDSVVTINNNATPAAPVATSDSRCGAGQITLHASAAAGTINWYANNTTETSLATGADFTTPELTSGAMTYYVGVTHNNCPSARVPVTATINPVPATTTNEISTIAAVSILLPKNTATKVSKITPTATSNAILSAPLTPTFSIT